MSRASRLKVTGVDFVRLANSPIARDQAVQLAGAHRKLWTRFMGRFPMKDQSKKLRLMTAAMMACIRAAPRIRSDADVVGDGIMGCEQGPVIVGSESRPAISQPLGRELVEVV